MHVILHCTMKYFVNWGHLRDWSKFFVLFSHCISDPFRLFWRTGIIRSETENKNNELRYVFYIDKYTCTKIIKTTIICLLQLTCSVKTEPAARSTQILQ